MTQFRHNLVVYPVGILQAYYIGIGSIMELGFK